MVLKIEGLDEFKEELSKLKAMYQPHEDGIDEFKGNSTSHQLNSFVWMKMNSTSSRMNSTIRLKKV